MMNRIPWFSRHSGDGPDPAAGAATLVVTGLLALAALAVVAWLMP